MEEVRRVGSVMLCGCILVSGVGDPEKYHQIFIHHAIPSENIGLASASFLNMVIPTLMIPNTMVPDMQ